MTLLTSFVTFYLRCRDCDHRYESDRRDTFCPVCLSASTRVYGVKVDKLPNQDWEGRPS